MENETRKRLKSFAKLLSLLLVLVVAGFWLVSRAHLAFRVHSQGATVPQCDHNGRSVQVDLSPAELKGDLALDSYTGQLCKTWAWNAQTPPAAARTRYERIPVCQILATSGSGEFSPRSTHE